eukprot:TRINITY_DN4031_c0_g1_i1.p1 TRINITY_DN4031_c0_g1~~TRINITY_DN4031_c0_g1_i1.p1  ORF type:complete len:52 (+),score=4.67 TRINITY_DN4031_c0_g1_i1:320-475(+)
MKIQFFYCALGLELCGNFPILLCIGFGLCISQINQNITKKKKYRTRRGPLV